MKWMLPALLISTAVCAQQCPVKAIGASFHIELGNVVDPLSYETLVIYYRNESEKPVKAVKFQAEIIDKVKDKKDLSGDFVTEWPLKPGKKASHGFKIRTLGPSLNLVYGEADASAWPVKVLFKDGSVWEDDGKRTCR